MVQETLLDLIVFLVVSFGQILLQQSTVLYISKVPATIRQLIFSGVILLSTNYISSYFFYYLSNVVIVIWIVLVILSYKFIFKQSIKKSFVLGIAQMVYMTCFEYFSQLILFLIGGNFHAMMYTHTAYTRLTVAAFMLLLYVVVRIFKFHLIPKNDRTARLWGVYIVFLFLFTYPNLLIMEQNGLIISSIHEIYNIILFLAFFIYNFLYVISLNKLSNISGQLEVQQLYSNTLQHSLDQLRGFKHDFSNIMVSLDGLIQMEQWDKLKEYMQNVNTEILKIKTSDIVNNEFREQPILYGILLSKASLAELTGIAFDVSVQCELNLHYCDIMDFSRMMGILLDNALEAAEQSEQRYAYLEITERHGQHRIVIRNSCNGDVDTSKIFQKGYSTKDTHSGLGLHEVKTIIEKYQARGYEMALETSCTDQVFTQRLLI